ncbi:MAG: cation:proton antiporter [Synechococcaceae cyanobacterium]|jgi:NhaP-type Na+/H+ or K+/H+ antiporter
MNGHRLELIWGLAFSLGAVSQLLARLSGLPAVVLLLVSGLVAGRAGLGWIQPEQLGEGLEPLVGLLVSLILFHGGLNLHLAGRVLQRSVVHLVLARLLLALPMVAWLAHRLAGLDLPLAVVFSAIVLSTGPTVITPLVRQMRLEPLSSQMLEAEGLILEPLAAVAALVLLELALGAPGGWREAGIRLLLRFCGGIGLGAAAGWLLAELLRRLAGRADPSLQLQLCVGTLFLMFSGAETLLPQSGLPAAVSAGVMVGLRMREAVASVEPLIAQLAMLAITVLFPLLAADLSLAELSPLGIGGLACVLALMLWRWPVLQVAGLGLPALDWRHRLIVSWIAPRGIVTAAVASLFALRLDREGVPGGGTLKGLVFLTILITVVLQGLTAPWLARRLGLVEPEEPCGVTTAEAAAQGSTEGSAMVAADAPGGQDPAVEAQASAASAVP